MVGEEAGTLDFCSLGQHKEGAGMELDLLSHSAHMLPTVSFQLRVC